MIGLPGRGIGISRLLALRLKDRERPRGGRRVHVLGLVYGPDGEGVVAGGQRGRRRIACARAGAGGERLGGEATLEGRVRLAGGEGEGGRGVGGRAARRR